MDARSEDDETLKTADLEADTSEPGEVMTSNQGLSISDDQNSLRAWPRGPTLLEDFHLREKITHFDHERIPERVVHARGFAAHGIFQVFAGLQHHRLEAGSAQGFRARLATPLVDGFAFAGESQREVREGSQVAAGAHRALGGDDRVNAMVDQGDQPVQGLGPDPAEALRKDVRAQKSDIISKTMNFDATQAAAFWPVYKAYEAERQALGNDRLAVIQDFADHFETLNDANAKGLLDRSMVIEEKRVALEKRYAGEFLKVLPGKTVARFFQVESRLNNLINLELASQIPLVN